MLGVGKEEWRWGGAECGGVVVRGSTARQTTNVGPAGWGKVQVTTTGGVGEGLAGRWNK